MEPDSPNSSSYSSQDPSMNVSVHSRQNLAQLSPYLNFDPGYLPPNQPEFIFLEGGSKQRGRFELAFSQIGASCMAGAALGGVGGFYNGMKSTTKLGQTGALRRTQLVNYVMKQGAARANTLGTLAVMYSGIGVILSWLRGTDDELNTIAAGTATGLLYKSTAGLRKCGIGAGVGLLLSSTYCLLTAKDKLEQMVFKR
uniref:Mitochondrial import inner membrane translocase subunit Tim23 n=1 Tax=Liposcelis bostrychophila TaxID=185214 RepID=A0A481SUR9_LIPBO|nr:hypothetical protein [Liposcelis bostrychophila]